jgi:uncharacterized membrane protein SirB2
MNYIVLAVLVAIGVYDLYLVFTKQATLSQRYQRLFPAWLDTIIFALGIFVICYLHKIFPQIDFTIWAIMLAFFGHLTFANKETYKE